MEDGEYHFDEIDRRILYHLTADARNTTAPMIAEQVDVTPATVRNRIHQLEEHGIIQGYHAAIDYEHTGGRTTSQLTCSAPVADRQRLAQEALEISGVVAIRELLAGRENLLVTVVGTDTDDISRISRELSDLGLEVTGTDTIHNEITQPYQPFAPDAGDRAVSLTDFRSLSGGAEVVEFTVSEEAVITGHTIEEASETGLLEDVLVVSVERKDEILTPKGDTMIQPGDVVTLFSRGEIPDQTIQAFESQSDGSTPRS